MPRRVCLARCWWAPQPCVEVIGHGAFGVVVQARHRVDQNWYAVKRIEIMVRGGPVRPLGVRVFQMGREQWMVGKS